MIQEDIEWATENIDTGEYVQEGLVVRSKKGISNSIKKLSQSQQNITIQILLRVIQTKVTFKNVNG